MSKLIITNLCMIVLLLSISLTCTARPLPTFSDVTPMKTHHDHDIKDVKFEPENCSGPGEEECLMRRTLAAHVDYIYTQKQQP